MKQIPLTQGKVALVDDADYEELVHFNWSIGRGYARRWFNSNGKGTSLFMHRAIMNPPSGFEVDHINGDKLDNRRANLRLCTRNQNEHNKPRYSNNTSGFKGVSWNKQMNKWRVNIKYHGVSKHLGFFESAEEGYEVYCLAAAMVHEDFANLGRFKEAA